MEATNAMRFSAREEALIHRMKEEYKEATAETGKIAEAERLDKEAKTYGQWQAISVGILGALVLGAGMSMVMVWPGKMMIPGIFIGVIGGAVAGIAYPVYKNLNQRKRDELTPQIRSLLSELSVEED